MDHAMRLLVAVQSVWARHGFWVGVAILLGLLAPTDSASAPPEVFWYRVFLPANATLTARMLYQWLGARSPRFAAVGAFTQLWLAWWLGHILGGFALTVAGRGIMQFTPVSASSPPFEPLGLLIVTLGGLWFVLSAIVMPLRFATAIAQEIQKYVELRCRKRQRLAVQP